MAIFRIKAGELGPVLEVQRKQIPDEVRRGLRVAAERARTRLVKVSPVDLGHFKNAWQVQTTPRGVQVENSAPYAGILERGARPHPVSAEGRQAIYRWVLRKLITGSGKARQRGGGGAGPKRVSKKAHDAATAITQAIVHKLRTRGQVGRFFVRDNMTHFTKWANIEINRQIANYFKKKAGL